MSQLEVFVCKFLAINRLPTGTIKIGKVTTLTHKIWNHSMKYGTLVTQWFTRTLSNSFLAGTQRAEIFNTVSKAKVAIHISSTREGSFLLAINIHSRFGNHSLCQYHFDTTQRVLIHGYVEKHGDSLATVAGKETNYKLSM